MRHFAAFRYPILDERIGPANRRAYNWVAETGYMYTQVPLYEYQQQ